MLYIPEKFQYLFFLDTAIMDLLRNKISAETPALYSFSNNTPYQSGFCGWNATVLVPLQYYSLSAS